MARASFLPVLLLTTLTTTAQDTGHGERSHHGFHASLAIGPAFGYVDDNARDLANPDDARNVHLKYSGTGAAIELRLGGAIAENWILTGDVVSRAITAPRVSGDLNTTAPTNLSVGDVIYGAGITHFVMPMNIEIGATLGTCVFTVNDTKTNTMVRSDPGFAAQLRLGKLWWLGRRLQAGGNISGSLSKVRNVQDGITEDLYGQWGMFTAVLAFQ